MGCCQGKKATQTEGDNKDNANEIKAKSLTEKNLEGKEINFNPADTTNEESKILHKQKQSTAKQNKRLQQQQQRKEKQAGVIESQIKQGQQQQIEAQALQEQQLLQQQQQDQEEFDDEEYEVEEEEEESEHSSQLEEDEEEEEEKGFETVEEIEEIEEEEECESEDEDDQDNNQPQEVMNNQQLQKQQNQQQQQQNQQQVDSKRNQVQKQKRQPSQQQKGSQQRQTQNDLNSNAQENMDDQSLLSQDEIKEINSEKSGKMMKKSHTVNIKVGEDQAIKSPSVMKSITAVNKNKHKKLNPQGLLNKGEDNTEESKKSSYKQEGSRISENSSDSDEESKGDAMSQNENREEICYFQKDININKDRYFTAEQLDYYEKNYKPKQQQNIQDFRIKNFLLSEEIGNGSFGRVYQGFDNDHGIVMAVKQVPISTLSTSFQNQQKKIQALEQEIELLRTLNHRNIVKYLGTYRDKKNLNIFLEYVPGGSLERIYKTYPQAMNENLVRAYTRQILEGIEYLHVNNAIHRDIKGANILVDSSGICKLADFGSSKVICGQTNQNFNSICGTSFWMSPEVIRQTGHNRYADIWSLGCTVYEMIGQRPPWSETTNISVLLTIAEATKPPKYPKNLSPELRSFLDCCFKIEPHQRANVYELLRHPFISQEAKIQKYHFTLDKIDEEMTPGPSNSEYSKKKTSSRDEKFSSSEGTSSAGRPKKTKKFFPSNANGEKDYSNKNYEKIIEDVNDENKSSLISSKKIKLMNEKRNGKGERISQSGSRKSQFSNTSKSPNDEKNNIGFSNQIENIQNIQNESSSDYSSIEGNIDTPPKIIITESKVPTEPYSPFTKDQSKIRLKKKRSHDLSQEQKVGIKQELVQIQNDLLQVPSLPLTKQNTQSSVEQISSNLSSPAHVKQVKVVKKKKVRSVAQSPIGPENVQFPNVEEFKQQQPSQPIIVIQQVTSEDQTPVSVQPPKKKIIISKKKVTKIDKSKISITVISPQNEVKKEEPVLQQQQQQVPVQSNVSQQQSKPQQAQISNSISSQKEEIKVVEKKEIGGGGPAVNRLLEIIDEVRIEEGIDVNSYHLPLSQQEEVKKLASQPFQDQVVSPATKKKRVIKKQKKQLQPLQINRETIKNKNYLRADELEVVQECPHSAISTISAISSTNKNKREQAHEMILAIIDKNLQKQQAQSASPPSASLNLIHKRDSLYLQSQFEEIKEEEIKPQKQKSLNKKGKLNDSYGDDSSSNEGSSEESARMNTEEMEQLLAQQ